MSHDTHDDRDDLGLDDDTIGRALYEFGGWLSRLAGGSKGEEAWDEGTDRIGGDLSVDQIGAAIEDGIMRGASFSERRRALRAYHERDLEGAAPLIDTTLIEDDAGDISGLRVLVSDPEAEVYTGQQHVLIRGDDVDRRVETPISMPTITDEQREGVLEFVVREQRVDVADDPDVDVDGAEAALEIVEADPGRAMLVLEEGGSRNANVLAGKLLESYPAIDAVEAVSLIESAAKAKGLNALEEAYDDQLEAPPETEGSTTMPEDLDGFVEDIDELADADALTHPESELADDEDDGGPVDPIEVPDDEEAEDLEEGEEDGA